MSGEKSDKFVMVFATDFHSVSRYTLFNSISSRKEKKEMRKIVMTQEIIDDFKERYKNRSDSWTGACMCKLCRPLWLASKQGLAEYCQERLRSVFKSGQDVYVVTYPNGTVGYYHVQCVDRLKALCSNQELAKTQPFYCMQLEEILRYDVDKWNTINSFIKRLIQNNKSGVKLEDSQIIAEIMKAYGCSHTTAWRRLRSFMQNLP